MKLHVRREVCAVVETFSTSVTKLRAYVASCVLVSVQSETEIPSTDFACVRQFPSVSFHVFDQTDLQLEFFIASVTFERLFVTLGVLVTN